MLSKYGSLLVGALARTPLRTSFTVATVAVAFAVFSTLETVRHQLDQPFADDRILLVRRHVGSLPPDYAAAVARIAGVEAAASVAVIPVRDAANDQRAGVLLGARLSDLAGTFPQMEVRSSGSSDWHAVRTAAICDGRTAELNGWKVGDLVSFELLPGEVSRSGSRFIELTLTGLFRQSSVISGCIGQAEYLATELPQHAAVGNVFVRTALDADPGMLAAQIDALSMNAPYRTETAPVNTYAEQFGDTSEAMEVILVGTMLATFFTMLLIAGSTLTQSVRERLGEFAVMQTLGFGNPLIVALIASEAVAIYFTGGSLGIVLGQLVWNGGNLMADGTVSVLTPRTIALAVVLMLLSGALSLVLPLWEVTRLRVADLLRKLQGP